MAPHSIFTASHLYRVCNNHLLKVPYDFGDLAEKAKGGHVVNTNHRRVWETCYNSIQFHFYFILTWIQSDFKKCNHRRVVETWMDDEHKEYFYTRVPLARYISWNLAGWVYYAIHLARYVHVCRNLAVFALSSKEHQIPKVETRKMDLIKIERTSNQSAPVWKN